jgi:hypothetical protein
MNNPPLVQDIRFGREICGDLDQAERREWWITNGLGGYAAGTIAGTLTRRYHGLLVAPVNAPLGRVLVFAKADASVIDGDRVWPLGTNRWTGGAVDPAGHRLIESFHLDGRMPVWRFALGNRVIEQRVWMEQGADTTYVAWRLEAGDEPCAGLRLRVRLLVNARDHHGQMPVGGIDPAIAVEGTRVSARFGDWFTRTSTCRRSANAACRTATTICASGRRSWSCARANGSASSVRWTRTRRPISRKPCALRGRTMRGCWCAHAP